LDTALLRGIKTKGSGSFTPIGKVVRSAPDDNGETTARVETYGPFDLEHVAHGTVLFSNGLIDSDSEAARHPREASRVR
jgi:hypothetical protein